MELIISHIPSRCAHTGFICCVSDPDPDWIKINQVRGSVSGSGFRIRIRIQEGNKDWQKHRKFFWNFMFWSAGCSLFRAEAGIFCSLDVLSGVLGTKCTVLFNPEKFFIFFPAINFFIFWSSSDPWIRIGVFSLKCWIPGSGSVSNE